MSKLKTLKEQRATVYTSIDELRKATDGKEMSSEEQQRWDTLLTDYDKADKAVEQEERFQDVQRRQLEEREELREQTSTDEEYRSAFSAYLLNGANGITHEERALFEKRAGLSGLSGGVIVPSSLSSSLEIALKSYGGMFEAASIISTSGGGDLIMPTINDTAAKASIVAEYNQSTKRTPSFGSEILKAYTYRTPIVPVSQELLQDSAFDLESLLSGLLAESFGRGINEDLTIGSGTSKPRGLVTSATDAGIEAAAAAITLDNVIDLIKSVDSPLMLATDDLCSTEIRSTRLSRLRIPRVATFGRREPRMEALQRSLAKATFSTTMCQASERAQARCSLETSANTRSVW